MDTTDFTFDYTSTDYANYTENNETYDVDETHRLHHNCFGEALCMFLLVINVIIILLGVVGNGVVIWIAGFKMKKTVNTTWYLSLAISDFIFCATLPFNSFYTATSDWPFGLFMCRFTSFVMFLNMFSSIFLLVVISADRYMAVIFPVWAQNQRTIRKASLIVLLAWVLAVSLSIPSTIFRDVKHHLSLAVSDFLFCAFLPLSIVYVITKDWVFGVFMCKFTSFILFLNMFSSIFLLLVISVDRFVVVMFPVWAQNYRTTPRAWVVVVMAWILSALLSLPATIFRDVHNDHHTLKHTCYDNYSHDRKKHIAVAVCRLLFGFLIPFLIIISCYGIISRKLRNNDMARSNKPFKVMTALIVAFFLSWMPYHFFKLLELNQSVSTGQIIGSTLASANSFMNPLLYAFMGKDFKRKCNAILSKIESTFEEEARSTLRGTSVTNSGDGHLSSAV